MSSWLLFTFLDMLLFAAAALLGKIAIKKNNIFASAALWSIALGVCCFVLLQTYAQGETMLAIDQKNWIFLIMAGVLRAGAIAFLFQALSTGECIRVIPVYLLHLGFAMVARVVLYHTTLGYNQWAGLAFIGVATILIVLKDGKGDYKWFWMALISAICQTIASLLISDKVFGVSGLMCRFVTVSLAIIFIWIVAAASGGVKAMGSMRFSDGILICLSALCLGGGWFVYRRALSLGPNHIIQVLDCMGVIVLIPLGILFLKEKLTSRGNAAIFMLLLGIWLVTLETPLLSLLT